MKSFGRISVAKIYNGTNSISVYITANSQVFISYDRGETFTPDVIKLTPNCQGGANFKSWQYSTDNGATWKALGNNTHDCTIDNKTHVLSIKHFSDIFGVGKMVSIRANIVENESTYDVFSIAKIYDGSAMTDGYNSEVVYLYKRSTTVPTIDWTETLNYNFTIKGLTTTPNGWSTTIPDGSDPLYVTSASAFSREIVDDIEPSEWTTPVLFKDKRSVTGIVNKYMVSALSEGVKTSDSGWKDTIPEMNSNKKYLWNYKIITYDKAPTQEITNPEVISIYGGNGSSVTYQVGDSGTNKPEGEWTENIPEVPDGKYLWTKVMMQQSDGSFTESYSVSYKGTSGSNGLNNATIYLYKRAKSTPAAPYTNVTYNFTNHTATGDDIAANKWRQTIPDGSDPIYITTATALNTEDTDIIEPSEWSEPQILSQNGSSISILRSSVTYQVGFSGTNRPTNDAGWTETIPETEAGKYLWTRTIVEYSDGTTTESYGVSYRSLDGTNGNDGRGVSNTSISYQVSDSGTEKPATWKAEIPEIPAGKYLWTKTVITYTDGKSSEIYSVSRSAKDGTNGKGISKVTEYYLASNKSEDITTKDADWNINVPTMTPTKRFLWNYEKTTYTDGTETNTTPAVIGVYGESGVGIKSITNYYKISNKNTDMSVEDTDWNTTPEPTTPEKPYLWNYELTVFTDNTNAKTKAHIIGTHGIAGVSITNVENWYLATGKDLGVTINEKGWSKNIKDHPLTRTNKYLWNYEKTILSDGTSKDTDPCIIGMYTEDGKGISNITEQYAVSNSATQIPLDSEWKNEMQTMTAEKRYLWNKETITYTDNSSHTTDAKVIGVYGDKGDDGTSVVKVINKYLATNLATGVTSKTAGWTNEIQTISESKKYLWNYEITQLSNGTELATEPCIIGTYAKDGKGISSIVEKYAVSDSNTVTPTTWADQVQTMTATKRYLWNYEIITYTDKSIKETDARVIGVYGRDGKNGVSITGVVNKYLASSKSTGITIDGNTWSNDVQPLNATNKYLWNYEITSLSDGTSITTDPCVIGTYSVDGVGIDHITEQYAVSNNNATAPTESQWKDTVQQMTSTNRYLWNREKIYYTDNLNTPKVSEARVIGVYGETGKDGKGISSIVTHYLATSASSGVTKDTTGWKETAQKTSSTNKYLWSYQTITYTDKTVDNTVPVIIGTYGEKGDSITIKSTSVTYQLANSGTEEPTGAWLSYVPDSGSGEYLWTKTTVIYSDDTEVNSFSVSYNGVNAKEGYETSVIYLYKRSKTVPTIDWTEKLTFNFATEKLVKEPRGWSQSIPSGTDTLYVTTATAFAQTITDTIEYTEWTTPVVYNKVRTNTKIENFYIASNKSNGISLSTSGWSTTFPALDDNNKYLWSYTKYTYDEAPLTETSDPKIIAIYGGNGSSVTYQVGNSGTEKPTGTWLNAIPNVPDGKYLWTKIVMMLSDGKSSESYSVSYKGKDGVNGINTATIYLYKRLETIPDKPSNNITYNFETSAATGEDISSGNWYLSIPGGNKPVYVITATAASTENTDTILPTEWSEPQILSKNGESISIESSSVEYQISISGTTKPTNEYGWTKDVPEVTQGQFLWSRTTVNYSDGTSTVSYNVSYIGNDGVSITEVINWYLASDQDSGITISTTGWDKSVANTPLTSTNQYLWNYEETIFSNGKNKQTEPCIIGTYSEDGKNGVGISGIAEKYAVSNSNETAPTDWKDAVPKMTATNKYLWNYEIISYTDGSTPHTTKPRVIGVYGDKGDSIKITSQSVSYKASSSGTEQPTSGWQSTIPELNSGEYLWTKTTVVYSDGTKTESFSVAYNGINAKEGYESAVVYLYKRATSVPTIDWKDTLYYNFTTSKLDKIPSGWSDTVPSGSGTLYVTTASAFSKTITDDIDYTEWTTPVAYNNTRTNTKIENFYLVSDKSSGVTTSTSGWSTTIPNMTNNKKYLWSYKKYTYDIAPLTEITTPEIISIYGGNGSSVTYQVGNSGTEKPTGAWLNTIPEVPDGKYLWTKIVILLNDGQVNESYSVSYKGIDGNNGLNTATVYLYKRSASAPNKPTAAITYNFKTKTLTGNDISSGNWSTTIPSGNTPIYIINATAANVGETDVIEATEWSAPQILSQNGTSVSVDRSVTEYQVGISGTIKPSNEAGWTTTMPEVPKGKFLWTRTTVYYTDGKSTISYAVSYQGADGLSAHVINHYLATSAKTGVTVSTPGWTESVGTQNFNAVNRYLWNYEESLYSDGTPVGEPSAPAIISVYTEDGKSVEQIEERYAASDSNKTAPDDSKFGSTVPDLNSTTSKYLWNYEIIHYIKEGVTSTSTTKKRVIGVYGDKGDKGNDGTSVTITAKEIKYAVSDSGTNPPTTESSWVTNVPTVANGKFLWTRTKVTYSQGDPLVSYSVSYKAKDGTSGSPGAEGKGYTILLSNEAHTFVAANPSTTTLNDGQSTATSVKAWRNTTSVNVNVTKVNDTAVSGNATVTVNNVVFTVSGNNTANAIITIKPTAKAALTGSFKFTISIDGLSFEKVFSYTSSCPGTKGDKGDKGDPGADGKDAYSVKLISSSQIFKSSDGGVTFTPNTITITPIYQNCSHSKWEFSIDGGATWNYVWQNTDFVVDVENTHTLTISSSSSVFTKDVTAVSLKCTTDKENVYDVITIAKIYDANDLVIGGRNFLSLITGDIGYCLRGYNPIKASDGSVDSTKCLDISVDSENGWISIFGNNNNTTNNLNIFYIVNRTDINLVGSTYTLSVEWKSSGKYPLFVTTNNSSKAVSTFVLPTTDKKLTFSVDENTVVQYVGIQIPTGTVISEDDKITFRCQLEQGTVVTDWKLDPIDLNQKYIESSSKVQSLTQSYSKFQAIFDSNKLTAESNINDTIKNLNDAINGTDSTQGIIARLNDIYNDPDNALKNSTHLFEFSTWKTSKDGLEALIGKIDENTSSLNELKVKNDGLTSTVTDLTTKGVLACMDFDADHGLTIQTPKKIGQEGGDTQARIVIDGDSVEGFSGNDERQFLIGNDGVQCKSLIVNGTTTIKNGLSFNYIKMRDYIAPMADSNGNRINGLDFTAVS